MIARPAYYDTGRIRGARLTWNSTTQVGIEVGDADVNGALLSWSSPLTLNVGTVANSTLYYVYLYSASGTATLEKSTTVPVWNSATQQWQKTGDATRRLAGHFATGSTGDVLPFDCDPIKGGERRMRVRYLSADISAASGDLGVVLGGQTVDGSTPISFDIGKLVPAHALSALVRGQIYQYGFADTLAAASIGRSSAISIGSPALVYTTLAVGDYRAVDADILLDGSTTLYYVTFAPTQTDVALDAMILGFDWER